MCDHRRLRKKVTLDASYAIRRVCEMKALDIALFALVFLSALRIDAAAHAYLDPGTGSMLLQLLLGGVAGALVVGKLYWSRMKEFFGGQPVSDPKQDPPPRY